MTERTEKSESSMISAHYQADSDNASIQTALPEYDALAARPPPFSESRSTADSPEDQDPRSEKAEKQSTSSVQKMKMKLKELKEETESHRDKRYTYVTPEEADRMTGNQPVPGKEQEKESRWGVFKVLL